MKRLAVVAVLLLSLAPPATAATAITWHPRTTTEAYWGARVTLLLNHQRANHGLPPVETRTATLGRSARHHDFHMAEVNTMSHCLWFERCMVSRDVHYGYTPWCYLGENIAWTRDVSLAGALHLERLLMTSPEHRANILSTHYRHVGIDVWIDRAHARVWFTQDFGAHYC